MPWICWPFPPNIAFDGTFDLQFRADTSFGNGLNIPGIFTGTILNREHFVKWNEAHADDPVTITD